MCQRHHGGEEPMRAGREVEEGSVVSEIEGKMLTL